MHPVVTCLLGGILPFGACFVEMFFIMSSVWMDQYYYVFGFLLVVFVILAVTCAEITIVLCYFQLCAEDYHWWWRSFMTSGELVLNEVFFFFY
jgi:transmembrane 9 superfamily member 2/4